MSVTTAIQLSLKLSVMLRRRPIWYARQWMAYKNLKQVHVITRTGLTKSLVSDYLSGKRRWNEDILAAFAHAIGCEPADLLKPPQPPPDEFSIFVMKLDAKKRQQALRILKAALGEEEVA